MPAACAPCGPCRNLSESMAEGVGFEPTREREPPGGFQDRCLKPLGHPSCVDVLTLLPRSFQRRAAIATGLPPDAPKKRAARSPPVLATAAVPVKLGG